MKISNIDPDILKKKHEEGHSDRQLAKIFGVHHNTIAYHRGKLALKCNRMCRQPIEKIGKTKARCSKCRVIKGLSQFISNRKGKRYEYKISYCHGCRKAVLRKNLNKSIESFLSDRYRRLLLKAGKSCKSCTITKQEIIDQYYRQGGLCFYTDVVLDWGVGKGHRRNALSVDCIIPGMGYVLGNTVLCTNKANTVKADLTLEEIRSWLPSWYSRILEFTKVSAS